MKVIFVIVSMKGGGAERVISILANQFVENGMEVTIMMTAGDEVAYSLNEKIHLICIGGRSGGSIKARLKRIKKMRDYFKADRDSLIISFGPGTSFFVVAADLFLKHKMIISERNDPAICEHKILRNIVYSRADRLVYQTEDAMNCFPVNLRKKGCVIPNPISQGLPEAYCGEREKTVVAVGRLERQKNHKLLLEAFSIFSKKNPGYKLHIFGEGSLMKELEQQISVLNIRGRVVMEGFCANVPDRIKKAGMYVLSSDYEGISNSLLEAMAMGIPSVSTDCPIGGSRLCIQSYENGILIPLNDLNSLVKAMCDVAGNKRLAKRLSLNAVKIRERYSEEAIAGKWIEVCTSCIK